jgi:acyl CoA:acetate/3-ketoacid CoA transferase beta subunit
MAHTSRLLAAGLITATDEPAPRYFAAHAGMAVLDIGPDGFVLTETAPGVSVADVLAATGAAVKVALAA